MTQLLAKQQATIRALAGGGALLLALTGITAAVGALAGWVAVAVLAGATLLLAALGHRLRKRVPRNTILEVDLERGITETVPPGPGRLLGEGALRLRDVVEALDRAANDKRVAALVARIGSSSIGIAQAQELRAAVARFRAAGKPTVAYAETFGEDGTATTDYYVAASFGRICLQPSGGVSLNGMVARVPFVKGLLDKLSLVPQFDRREEYKVFSNRLTETGFTEPHREAVTSVLDSQFDALVADIATDRNLDAAAVRAAVDRAPLLPGAALASGIVDELAHRDEVYHRLATETGGRPLYLGVYLKRAGRPHRKGPGVALLYATGVVARGASRFSLLPVPSRTMGSDTVAAAFRAAVRNPKVGAIVCRVDSRGGSAVASDVIRREVVRAREAGTPVVVSMGNYAASGGYYIASGADRIVAQPGTITGSIGVVSGKVVAAEAWLRAGITHDEVARGANARYWSSGHPYDEEGTTALHAFLDDVYERFVHHVASGRAMAEARVRELAKGRVWTGAQAHEHGLVDALGGVDVALDLAKEAAGIPPEATVKLVEYPKKRRRIPPERRESSEAARMAAESLRALEGIGGAVAAAAPRGELVLPAGF